MEQSPLVEQLRQQIRIERNKYLQAIEEGKEFFEAKEIVRTMNVLQMQLEKLTAPRKDDYQGV